MTDTVFLNGDWPEKNEAKISIFDRGFLFADGVYEVIPVFNGNSIDFEPFVARLLYSLNELSLPNSFASLTALGDSLETQLSSLIDRLIKLNNVKEGGVYLQVTRGVFSRSFPFPKDIEPTFMAFAFSQNIYNNSSAKTGVKVVTTEDIRWKRRDIKSIALLGQCMGKQHAVEHDAFEAWMVEDGFITEGTSSTAYIVKDKTIITRPLSNSILPGIRRKVILAIAEKNQLSIEERLFSVEEALQADEAFMSSATTCVMPVIQINETQIANGLVGDITQQVRDLYIQNAVEQTKGLNE